MAQINEAEDVLAIEIASSLPLLPFLEASSIVNVDRVFVPIPAGQMDFKTVEIDRCACRFQTIN